MNGISVHAAYSRMELSALPAGIHRQTKEVRGRKHHHLTGHFGLYMIDSDCNIEDLAAVHCIAHIALSSACLSALLFILDLLDPLGSRQACGDKKKVQVHWTCLVFGRFG